MFTPHAPTFRLRNASLLCALAAAFPAAVQASAGVAQFTSGPVSVNKSGLAASSLNKGGIVASGDTIVTGADGRAQLRFSDGGLVSLIPNSQFKIENYADVNDGKADRFLVNLLQGGMRAITGLIGKRNRDNYKVQTATATIGIRGSGFSLAYNPDGSLSVTTELDGIEVCTSAGCIGLTAGESALVKASDAAPQRTNSRSSLPIPAPRREPQVVGDQTNALGTSAGTVFALPAMPPAPAPAPTPNPPPNPHPAPVPPPPPPPSTNLTQTGWAIRTADLLDTNGGPPPTPGGQTLAPYAFRAADKGTYTSTAAGTPVDYVASTQRFDWQTGVGADNDQRFSDTSVDPAAVSPFMVMGYRTPSAYLLNGNIVPNTSVSTFVMGAPASAAGLTAMASSLPSARYNLLQATPVFSTNSSTGQSRVSASLTSNSYVNVDFAGVGNYIDVNLNVLFTTSGEENGNVNLRGSGRSTGSTFGGTLATTSEACTAGTDICAPGNFQGFFSGPAGSANYLGLTYGSGTSGFGRFAGAAVFGNPTPISPSLPAALGVNYHLSYAHSEIKGGANTESLSVVSATGQTVNVLPGQVLNQYQATVGSQLTQLDRGPASATDQSGSIGRYGDADFIGWGYWTGGTRTQGAGATTNLSGAHFLIASPASGLSAFEGSNVQMQYKFLGGTNPTATSSSGANSTGTLLNATLQVNYSATPAVDAGVTVQFGGTTLPTLSISGMGLNLTTGSFGSATSPLRVNGTLSGNQGSYGGFVYGFNDANLGAVRGTAVFQR